MRRIATYTGTAQGRMPVGGTASRPRAGIGAGAHPLATHAPRAPDTLDTLETWGDFAMITRNAGVPAPTVGADRLRRLVDAQRAITNDLSLTSVLERVVRVACELVGARYGAVGVLAEDGSLEQFIHRGLTPPMRSFLGVPIRTGGVAFGELYLADPRPTLFDAEDESLVVALAATAGAAIENARLYERARRSRDWLRASGEIARALLAEADDEVLLDVVSRALDVAEADYAALILPTEDGRLRVTVAKGLGADTFRRHVFDPTGSVLGRAILRAESIRTHDMTQWANADFDNRHGYGPAMIVPLVHAHRSRGAVLMMRTAARVPFTPADVELASTFAAQVAIALELNDARAEAERVRVLEDRHKIAQDLHDNVMQRLFAIGVGLQSVTERHAEPETDDRLRRYIGELDETIDQIRTRVFGLRGEAAPEPQEPRRRFFEQPALRH